MKPILVILLFNFIFSDNSIIPPEFNGNQAFEYIKKQCEFGPRYPGSEGHKKLADYLYNYFILNADSVIMFSDSILHPFNKKKV